VVFKPIQFDAIQYNARDTCGCRAALGVGRTTVHRRFDAKETSAFPQMQDATSASIISSLELQIISYSRDVRQMLNEIKQTTFRNPTKPPFIFSDIPSATAKYFSIFDVSIPILRFPDSEGQTNAVYFKAIQLSQFSRPPSLSSFSFHLREALSWSWKIALSISSTQMSQNL
jgi:hypothetical protein